MASREDIIRNLKSRDTVYSEDFEAVLDYIDNQEGGGTVGMQWRFRTDTADVDPGTGRMRWNNATPASVTAIITSDFTDGGVDVSNILALVDDTFKIYVQQQSDGATALALNVTGDVVDNTTHFTIPVSVAGSGILPGNNAKLFMLLFS